MLTKTQLLEQMPPSKAFHPSVKFFAMDKTGLWWAYLSKPSKSVSDDVWRGAISSNLEAVRMPIINKIDWHYSLISVDELREFQKN